MVPYTNHPLVEAIHSITIPIPRLMTNRWKTTSVPAKIAREQASTSKNKIKTITDGIGNGAVYYFQKGEIA